MKRMAGYGLIALPFLALIGGMIALHGIVFAFIVIVIVAAVLGIFKVGVDWIG